MALYYNVPSGGRVLYQELVVKVTVLNLQTPQQPLRQHSATQQYEPAFGMSYQDLQQLMKTFSYDFTHPVSLLGLGSGLGLELGLGLGLGLATGSGKRSSRRRGPIGYGYG